MERKQVAIVFDVDGVLHRGSQSIPGAPEALKRVQEADIPYMLLTNSGGKTEEEKALHYERLLGVTVPKDRICQAHSPLKALSSEYATKRVLLVGPHPAVAISIANELGMHNVITVQEFACATPLLCPHKKFDASKLPPRPTGFNYTEKIDAVLVLEEPFEWEDSLQIVVDVLKCDGDILDKSHVMKSKDSPDERQHIPIYFANPDVEYAGLFHIPRFTCGAFRLCVETLYQYTTGKQFKPVVVGKPYAVTYKYAEQYLHRIAKEHGLSDNLEVYAIGDNPLSDIKGANDMGWFSILVRTGCFQSLEDNDRNNPAKLVCPSVVEAIDFIISQQKANMA